jgi:hypothetical protein
MTLPTESSPSVSVGLGGDEHSLAVGGLSGGIVTLDPFLYQDMRHCSSCERVMLFQPVERFDFGWRGYCWGCGEEVYVMDQRSSGEAA